MEVDSNLENQEQGTVKSSKLKSYLKKIGIAGFIFFLVKGLIWLFIFLGGLKLLFGE